MADTQITGTLSADEPISGGLSANEGIDASLTPDEEVSGALEVKRTRSVPTVLNDLGDVDINSPQNGDALVYDSTTGEWVNGAGQGGDGVWGAITGDIDDQTDLQGELAKKVITLTKAQYDALSAAEKNDPKKVYFITDYEATGTYSEIDDTSTAIDKLWSSSKISSELNSTTRIDDTTTAQNKTWSSTKISTEIDGKLSYSVNDATDTDIADADFVPYYDYSAAAKKKSTWANIIAKIKAKLATVATTGSYNDLSNKPAIPAEQIQSDWNQTTTTAKDYIKNKPTIPAAQVNSDLNSSSGVSAILNKPDLSVYAPLASPAFTGTPTAPTASYGTDTTQIATTAFVNLENSTKYDVSDTLANSIASSNYIPFSSGMTRYRITASQLAYSLGSSADFGLGYTITMTGVTISAGGMIVLRPPAGLEPTLAGDPIVIPVSEPKSDGTPYKFRAINIYSSSVVIVPAADLQNVEVGIMIFNNKPPV